MHGQVVSRDAIVDETVPGSGAAARMASLKVVYQRGGSRALLSITVVMALLGHLAGCNHDETYEVPGLIKMLQEDSDPDMRYTAAKTLGYYGPEAQPAVPQLSAAMKDPSAMVRMGAAYALAEIGLNAKAAVPALKMALKDKDADVRAAAIYAISLVGPSDPTVLAVVQPALRDPVKAVRTEAIQSVRRLRGAAKYRNLVVDADPSSSEGEQ